MTRAARPRKRTGHDAQAGDRDLLGAPPVDDAVGRDLVCAPGQIARTDGDAGRAQRQADADQSLVAPIVLPAAERGSLSPGGQLRRHRAGDGYRLHLGEVAVEQDVGDARELLYVACCQLHVIAALLGRCLEPMDLEQSGQRAGRRRGGVDHTDTFTCDVADDRRREAGSGCSPVAECRCPVPRSNSGSSERAHHVLDERPLEASSLNKGHQVGRCVLERPARTDPLR